MNDRQRHPHQDLDALLREVHHEEAARLRMVWDLAGDEELADFPDPEAVRRVQEKLEATLESSTRRHQMAPSPARTPNRTRHPDRPARGRRGVLGVRTAPWRLAGALLVALVLGGLGLFWWLSPVVRTAPPGERLAFGLPDGSRIELNSGSSVRYARRFGQARRVMLEGEAFFDVVKETRPFVVQTFNARVTVLGTRFNVRAWSRSVDPGTTVTLESGRVALAPADGPGQAVALEPGQTRRISSEVREPSPPDTVATGAATAWRNGDLVFKDQWLGVILEDVERHFAVDLVLAAPALREKPMTVAWRNPASADAVIRDVCAALGLSYRATSNGYEIYAPPPL